MLKGVNLKVYPGQGHRPRRRQRCRQVDPDQGPRRRPALRRRRDARSRVRSCHLDNPREASQARHRGRLPGPRAVREPRHRPEHVPRPRGDRPGHPQQRRDGEARLRDARLPVRPHHEVGAAEGLVPLRRTAADRRDRPRGAAEGQGRHPRRADRRARRRPDGAGADLVRRLADQGVGVLIISHNLADVFQVADYINVLYLGTMVAAARRPRRRTTTTSSATSPASRPTEPSLEGARPMTATEQQGPGPGARDRDRHGRRRDASAASRPATRGGLGDQVTRLHLPGALAARWACCPPSAASSCSASCSSS